MPFRTLVGHGGILRLLGRAIARDSLPPALLFAGPAGVGKRGGAMAVAEALNCLQPAASVEFDYDACGQCRSCQRIARRLHGDVVVVEPGESGAIKVEQVRDVIDRTAFRPFEGRRRVVIVDDADAMVPAAQNALLKTLEEPPAASAFILVSSMADSLLPTVRSRCPVLRFGPLPVADLVDLLVRQHGYSAADAHAAAADADGSVARALALRSVDLVEVRAAAQQVLDRTAHLADSARRLEVAEILKVKGESSADERNRLGACLRALLSLLRDVAIIASRADASLVANADLEGQLRRVAGALDAARMRRAFGAVEDALAALDRNASPKIVADWLVLQL